MQKRNKKLLSVWQVDRIPLITVGVGLSCLAALFAPEITAAVSVWSASSAYGHCWLVLPIAAWLLWDRRDRLPALLPRPSLWSALLALPAAGLWLAADWLGIMEGRQLAAIAFAETLLLAAFGLRMFLALSTPLLYLVFLVPFGAFLTPALQSFTTAFILHGLEFLNIPFDADAFRITIPEGVFYVAEACAGLRFLIASVAFGVLFAVTMFQSPWRRAAFIAISCVVPVVANGMRGLGIVVLGHALGSAQAGAADHLIYGWVFFSAVILLLAAGGFAFRDDMAAASLPTPPHIAHGKPGWPATLAACAPVPLAAALTIFSQAPGTTLALAARPPSLVTPHDCSAQPARITGAVYRQAFLCGDARVLVTATTLPAGANPASIMDAGRLAAQQDLGADIDTEAWRPPDQPAHPWMLMHARDTDRSAAFAVWSGGVQSIGGLRARLNMASAMLHGTATNAAAIAVTVTPGSVTAQEQLKSFLALQKALFAP